MLLRAATIDAVYISDVPNSEADPIRMNPEKCSKS